MRNKKRIFFSEIMKTTLISNLEEIKLYLKTI